MSGLTPDNQSVQSAYRRRMIIEFQDFDDDGITSRHIKMLLAAFDIKRATVDYIARLRDSVHRGTAALVSSKP